MKRIILFLLLISPLSQAQISIVFLGDSLTAGYGIDQNKAFPSLIESQLKSEGYDIKVTNAGISGATTANGVEQYAWISQAKPHILFLALGANDGLRGVHVPASKKNLEKVIQKAQSAGTQVLLAGMTLPPNYGKSYIDSFEKMYVDLEKAYGLTRIPFLLKGVAGIRKFNLPDGIHPNEKGHKIIAETLLPYFKKAIKK